MSGKEIFCIFRVSGAEFKNGPVSAAAGPFLGERYRLSGDMGISAIPEQTQGKAAGAGPGKIRPAEAARDRTPTGTPRYQGAREMRTLVKSRPWAVVGMLKVSDGRIALTGGMGFHVRASVLHSGRY